MCALSMLHQLHAALSPLWSSITKAISLLGGGLDDVRVTRVGDGQHADAEVLSASSAQVHVVCTAAGVLASVASVADTPHRLGASGWGMGRKPKQHCTCQHTYAQCCMHATLGCTWSRKQPGRAGCS
jgi:hypothetical protein